MKFYRLSDATFYDCINTIYQFIKPFLDNKMSIFEKYGAINSFTAIGDDNTLANSVNPDETAHNEPSHLDLHCLTFHPSTLH